MYLLRFKLTAQGGREARVRARERESRGRDIAQDIRERVYRGLFVVVDLGRQEVTHVANLLDRILDHQRNIGRHTERHLAREAGGLCEEVEVAQRERERHRLFELNVHRLFGLQFEPASQPTSQ